MMTSRWILHTALIAWTYSMIYIFAAQAALEEGHTPVGATRVFPRTSFSCLDRPSGYYADIETGCQIYHMCDGLGRQFSYSCPNTTLFQQRMLICDHWYMVNCSRAEGDYSANLLIGQRDKPFVSEKEHQQRTPRPDLLDRPYAPDYSGESFRNQYKDLPPIHNHIIDTDNDFSKPLPTRWSLRKALKTKENPIYSNRRNDDIEDNDLGTSFSTHYNTSGDISTENIKSYKTTDSNTIIKPDRPLKIKIPSKIYEPPFLNPIYNTNYTEESETTTTMKSTSPEVIVVVSTEQIPTTFAGRPFEPTAISDASIDSIKSNENKQKTTNQDYDFSKLLQQPTPESERTIDSTTPISIRSTSEDRSEENFTGTALDFDLPDLNKTPLSPPLDSGIPTPARDLLPPFLEYVIHDTATTQGPPIYYEWKTPSDSLEPPKLAFPDILRPTENEPEIESETESTITSPPFGHNPFLTSLLRTKNSSDRKSATPRSIQSRNSPNSNEGSLEATSDAKIEELQRELLIPDFLFPLESDARTGYELEDTLNSFQLKIPRKRNVNRQRCAGCRLT